MKFNKITVRIKFNNFILSFNFVFENFLIKNQ